jgi:outer membrane protein
MPKEKFSPYLGAGLNYTIFYGSEAAAGLGSLKLSNNVGYAVQAGFDYALTRNMYLNVDVKQIFLSTNAKLAGGAVRAKTDLNPLVVGVGVGWKF